MKERQLQIEVEPLAPGIVGLVQAVAHLAGEDADELVGISSAAFCNYAFDPSYNQHEDTPREYSPHALLFSNYGPWPSIEYYAAREVREVTALPAVDTLKVVVFEIDNERPIVTLTPSLEPAIVTGYRVGVDERVVITTHGEVEVRDDRRLQGDEDIFRNWLLLVRPGGVQEWAAPRVRQQINVLRWAVEHGSSPKEFFQETTENYAPGLQGVRRLRAFLDTVADAAAAHFAEQHVAMLAEQRRCAAVCVRRWASNIAAATEVAAVETELAGAADAYAAAHDALTRPASLTDRVDRALQAEEEALRRLTVAAKSFPAPFEL